MWLNIVNHTGFPSIFGVRSAARKVIKNEKMSEKWEIVKWTLANRRPCFSFSDSDRMQNYTMVGFPRNPCFRILPVPVLSIYINWHFSNCYKNKWMYLVKSSHILIVYTCLMAKIGGTFYSKNDVRSGTRKQCGNVIDTKIHRLTYKWIVT